jgi:hypothetical protein
MFMVTNCPTCLRELKEITDFPRLYVTKVDVPTNPDFRSPFVLTAGLPSKYKREIQRAYRRRSVQILLRYLKQANNREVSTQALMDRINQVFRQPDYSPGPVLRLEEEDKKGTTKLNLYYYGEDKNYWKAVTGKVPVFSSGLIQHVNGTIATFQYEGRLVK